MLLGLDVWALDQRQLVLDWDGQAEGSERGLRGAGEGQNGLWRLGASGAMIAPYSRNCVADSMLIC